MTDAMRVAEEIVSAANVTTCDGYYEVDIDAAAAVIERAIADAVAKERTKAEALAEALRVFADEAWKYEPDEGDSALAVWDSDFTLGDVRKATAALKAWETPST